LTHIELFVTSPSTGKPKEQLEIDPENMLQQPSHAAIRLLASELDQLITHTLIQLPAYENEKEFELHQLLKRISAARLDGLLSIDFLQQIRLLHDTAASGGADVAAYSSLDTPVHAHFSTYPAPNHCDSLKVTPLGHTHNVHVDSDPADSLAGSIDSQSEI
jgi:hypothetical protein